jgi:hypothetical protein
MTVVTFTTAASANWTCPVGVTSVKVECWGGGGSGGGEGDNAGGGGGEYAAEATLAVTPGNLYAYVVGAAGTDPGSFAGAAGASSTFAGNSVTVTAHAGGGAATQTSPGAGGTGSINTTHYNGGAGGNGASTGGGGGGGGGVANWHAATTYGLNDRVLVVEKELQGPLFHQTWVIVGWTLYVSLQAGNTGNNPPDSPAWWGTGSSPFDAASSGYHFQILHSHQGNQRQLFSKFMTPTESAGIAGLPLLLKTPYMVIRGDELTCQVRNVQVIPSALQVQVVLFGGEFD